MKTRHFGKKPKPYTNKKPNQSISSSTTKENQKKPLINSLKTIFTLKSGRERFTLLICFSPLQLREKRAEYF